MSINKGRIAQLQIRSQDLLACLGGTISQVTTGMSAFPLDAARESANGTRRGVWRERDLRRALAVARNAKLRDYRVEIAPDGTISIVVTPPGPGARH